MDGWSRKVEVKREQSWVGAGEEDENVRGRERKIDLPRAYLRYAFYSFLRSLARSLEPPFLRSFLPSLSFSLSRFSLSTFALGLGIAPSHRGRDGGGGGGGGGAPKRDTDNRVNRRTCRHRGLA